MRWLIRGSVLIWPWLKFILLLKLLFIKVDSTIFLSKTFLFLKINFDCSQLIAWLFSIIWLKTALFVWHVRMAYLCWLIRFSSALPVWPTYTWSQSLHGILYTPPAMSLGLWEIILFFTVTYENATRTPSALRGLHTSLILSSYV